MMMDKTEALKLLECGLINIREMARQIATQNKEIDLDLFANRYRSNLSKKIRLGTLKEDSKEVIDLCNLSAS